MLPALRELYSRRAAATIFRILYLATAYLASSSEGVVLPSAPLPISL